MPPAARFLDMHVCPQVTGIVPHVGGPILMFEPTVLIGFLFAAREGDMCLCVGPPDKIAKGSLSVKIGNKPAARLGDPTQHGGSVIMGFPMVMIGDAGSGGAGIDPGALASHKAVKAGLKAAADLSDIGGKNPKEHGGFILSDPNTGQVSVAQWPPGKGASISVPSAPDGKYQGKNIIGSFHTHPNVGGNWKAEPSDPDIAFVKNHPENAGAHHYVVSKDNVYHIDNTGKVTDMGSTGDMIGK